MGVTQCFLVGLEEPARCRCHKDDVTTFGTYAVHKYLQIA